MKALENDLNMKPESIEFFQKRGWILVKLDPNKDEEDNILLLHPKHAERFQRFLFSQVVDSLIERLVPKKKETLGELAYNARLQGSKWNEIPVKEALNQAKLYALSRNLPWPIKQQQHITPDECQTLQEDQ